MILSSDVVARDRVWVGVWGENYDNDDDDNGKERRQ